MAREDYPYIKTLSPDALMAPSVLAQQRSTHESGEAYALFDESGKELNPDIIGMSELVVMRGLLAAKAIIKNGTAEDFYVPDDIDIACCHSYGSDVVPIDSMQTAELLAKDNEYLLRVSDVVHMGKLKVINAGLSECGEAWPIRPESRYAFITNDSQGE